MIDKAKAIACETITETDNFLKFTKLVESAKYYQSASELAEDKGVKLSLVYLAAFKVSEANMLKSTLNLIDQNRLKPSKVEIVSKDAILFGNRLLFDAHLHRISGLNKVIFPRIVLSILNKFLIDSKTTYNIKR